MLTAIKFIENLKGKLKETFKANAVSHETVNGFIVFFVQIGTVESEKIVKKIREFLKSTEDYEEFSCSIVQERQSVGGNKISFTIRQVEKKSFLLHFFHFLPLIFIVVIFIVLGYFYSNTITEILGSVSSIYRFMRMNKPETHV